MSGVLQDSAARAWLALALCPGLPPRLAFESVAAVGGPAALVAAPAARLRVLGLTPRASNALTEAVARVPDEIAAVAALGGRVLAWSDPDYPPLLRQLADPPPALFVRGDATGLGRPAVAVVGARRATGQGQRLAEELACDLASAGLVVVSGLAAGIDAAAHRGALAASGTTVAVMGTGIDAVYPAWHGGLARRIAAHGALVSEFPLGTPPLPRNFPRRNRLVSGLALGTVVVEAAPRSGSLVTARLAAEQNRQVFAVPGEVGRREHQGTLALIREGATLVRGAADVLEDLAPHLVATLEAAVASREVAKLGRDETRVFDALRHQPKQLEDLVKVTGIGVARASEVLLELELRGLIRQTAGKRFRLRAA